MKNFYTRTEIDLFKKPFFTGKRWIGFDEEELTKILLTQSRCAVLGFPVGDNEQPAAYRYTV